MKMANVRANQDLGNTRDFGEHAAEGGNIYGIDEYTKEGGNKHPPLWEYGTRLFVYATKRQRKGWQPARAALAGNATLMGHSLVDQTALTKRP